MAEMKLIVSIDENGVSSEKYVPLSKAEIAEREANAVALEQARVAREAEEAAKAEAKATAEAKALELGLTAEEIAALTA